MSRAYALKKHKFSRAEAWRKWSHKRTTEEEDKTYEVQDEDDMPRTAKEKKTRRSSSAGASTRRKKSRKSKSRSKRSSSHGAKRGKRSKQKFKRKYVHPTWFKTLCKQNPVDPIEMLYGQALDSTTTNTQFYAATFLHRSIQDITNVMSSLLGLNASTNPTKGAQYAYMSDFKRIHTFKNNNQFTRVKLFLYRLQPRREGSSSASQLLMVQQSNNYNSAFQLNPPLMQQPFVQDAKVPQGATALNFSFPGITPYDFPTLTRLFKIRPYKVWWQSPIPARKPKARHYGYIEPGEQLSFMVKRLKPYMMSYDKYGIDVTTPSSVGTLYEWLKETPLLLIRMEGTVAHSIATPANVVLGNKGLDYYSIIDYNQVSFSAQGRTTGTYTTNIPTVANTDVEQGIVVVGTENKEVVD